MSSRDLIRLRDSASDFLERKVTDAVITVPTDFSDIQKEALVAVAKAGELEVLQIIREPVAAVLAYAARQIPEEQGVDKNILVADLRGTRCDTAVVASRGGMYTILATAHDYGLGGLKLDEVLVDYFSKEFIKKHKADLGNERSLAKLRLEAEGTKRTLSLGTSATISIESLADGYDFYSTINRLRYELSAKKVFDQIVSLVENVVKRVELDLLDIGEVILLGGTSHTPKIAFGIATLFPDSVSVNAPATLTTALIPSELSARSAVIQASLIAEFNNEDIKQSTHPAVTIAPYLSHPIGVVIGEDNSSQAMLEAQTAAPARRITQFDIQSDGDVIVRICEGIREIVVEKVERQVNGEKGRMIGKKRMKMMKRRRKKSAIAY
ncbi:actin-like ATPase domain-containing protein [Choiromyces venosus 120613-1]|uniref:Actin-like ATPase domain-containing protein n=1 Tax=Choiromyces venosus 120613-1 TaxID=1336337 RepID=A0A3N4J2M5_9PEZI|nr:actin-like ATPase domain-containing protein [Choiromyces venosus 120613-1]